ncbi:MAG: hypothetical protein A2133_10100 [Actinobacteria bacterium RBG_16_64_13]|nr:MAG: hypothetical protein A2133_10100 [Actinobacteria bacterium RBG_16_64_13]
MRVERWSQRRGLLAGRPAHRPARPGARLRAQRLACAAVLTATLAVALVLVSAGTARAADWTEVPFPPAQTVWDVAQDTAGNVWVTTLEDAGTLGHVLVLWNGAAEWQDACDGLDWSAFQWDHGLISMGDKLFLVVTGGACYARSAGDTVWHPIGSSLPFYDISEWDGYLWGGSGYLGVVRLDPATEQTEAVNAGLPMVGDNLDNTKDFWAPRGNGDYLYVGFTVTDEVASDPTFGGVGVYRLARGSATWEDTGLKVMPLGTDFGSERGTGGLEWGVWGVAVMDGYVLAEISAPSEALTSRLFLFDERAGTWTTVSLPSEQPVWYYLNSEVNCFARDGEFYFPAGLAEDGALFDVFAPTSQSWRQGVRVSGTAWAPLGNTAQAVGDELLVGSRASDGTGGTGTTGDGATLTTEASFVESVPLPTQISKDPAVIGTNFGLALLFALVFGFTSTLFNSTLKSNGDRIARAFSPLGRAGRAVGVTAGPHLRRFGNWLRAFTFRSAAMRRATARMPRLSRRWRERAAIVLVAALIYAFLDPTFGFSGHGVNIFFSLLISVTIVTAAYEGTQAVTSSRGFRIPAALKLFPAAIAIAILCVLLSRLSGFTPGYLYGFVGGLAFLGAQQPDKRRHGRIVLVGATCLLAVSMAAWFLAIPVARAAEAGSGWAAVIQSMCAATFVAGLEGVLFGLVPLTFLDGGALFHWNKVLWASLFGVATFLFWHVLLNKNSKYGAAFEQTNTQVVLALLGFWTLITVGTFLLLRQKRPGTAPPPPPPPARWW